MARSVVEKQVESRRVASAAAMPRVGQFPISSTFQMEVYAAAYHRTST